VKEALIGPETPPASDPFISLQTRLLLAGNSLNPNARNLPPVTEEALGTFAKHDYSLFNTVSTNERQEYWRGEEDNNFIRQKESWTSQVVSLFKDNQQFFQTTEKGTKITAVFSHLGINSQQFSVADAQSLFDRYCSGESGESNIKNFVADVVDIYDPQNLPAIFWIAGMFGQTSAEIVKHLVEVEARLTNQPGLLVQAANAGHRINHLNPDEIRLLHFLNPQPEIEEPDQPTSPTHQPLPEGYEWRSERNGRLSAEEAEEEIAHIKDPETIAAYLINQNPAFANYGEQIVNEINQQRQKLKDSLNRRNIREDLLLQIVNNVIEHFRGFVKNTHGIDLPQIEGLDIFPITDLTSKIYNPMQADAFVRAGIPLIFLDMDQLEREAFGEEKVLLAEEFERRFRNVFAGTIIHEYTHLSADHARRRLVKVDENGQVISEIDSGLGKLGLMFIRYFVEGDVQLRVKNEERGRELNEAVTEKMVEKWSHTYPYKAVEATAYPAERQVLNEIIDLISEEKGLSEEEVFAHFVAAHFDKNGLLPLVRLLSGPVEHGGKVVYSRPNFLSHVYALMDYEANKVTPTGQAVPYSLTLAYIKDGLNPAQIREIGVNVYNGNIRLSTAAREILLEMILPEEVWQNLVEEIADTSLAAA